MGRLTDDVAENTLFIAATSQRYLANPDVVASAILDPVGAARFEAGLLAALDGPDGLTVTSVGIGLRGAAFRASAQAYQVSEELNARGLDAIRWLEGTPIGVMATASVLAGPTLAEVYGTDGGNWGKFLVDHPGLVDQVVGMSPGLLSSLLGRGTAWPTRLPWGPACTPMAHPGSPMVVSIRTKRHHREDWAISSAASNIEMTQGGAMTTTSMCAK